MNIVNLKDIFVTAKKIIIVCKHHIHLHKVLHSLLRWSYFLYALYSPINKSPSAKIKKDLVTFPSLSNFTKSIFILSITVLFETPSICFKDKLVVYYLVLTGEYPLISSPALHIKPPGQGNVQLKPSPNTGHPFSFYASLLWQNAVEACCHKWSMCVQRSVWSTHISFFLWDHYEAIIVNKITVHILWKTVGLELISLVELDQNSL